MAFLSKAFQAMARILVLTVSGLPRRHPVRTASPWSQTHFSNYGATLPIMSSLTTWTPDGSKRKDVCPVLDNPEPDCYCMLLSSLDVPRAVQFCLRDFRDCPIYKRYMGAPWSWTSNQIGNEAG